MLLHVKYLSKLELIGSEYLYSNEYVLENYFLLIFEIMDLINICFLMGGEVLF